MNKIKLFIIAAFITLSAGSAMAQKTGYISLDNVVALMPEAARLDSMLSRFQQDSLNPQFSYLVTEYNRKDSILNDSLRNKLTPQVKNQIRQELENIAYQVQNWQPFVQNALQAKQNEMLEPIYRKAMNAVQQVAKENGYSYVYNKEALLVAPPGDDLLQLVGKKLNLKIPATVQPGIR